MTTLSTADRLTGNVFSRNAGEPQDEGDIAVKIGRGVALTLGIGVAAGITLDRAVQAQNPPPAYYINETKVNDPETIKPYLEAVRGIVEKYGGRYLARGGKAESLEGSPLNGNIIVIAFKSVEDAQKWYRSPEYQAIVGFRHKAATSRNFIVEGLPN